MDDFCCLALPIKLVLSPLSMGKCIWLFFQQKTCKSFMVSFLELIFSNSAILFLHFIFFIFCLIKSRANCQISQQRHLGCASKISSKKQNKQNLEEINRKDPMNELFEFSGLTNTYTIYIPSIILTVKNLGNSHHTSVVDGLIH